MWSPGPSIKMSSYDVYSYTHSQNQLQVLLCPVPDSRVCAYMRAVKAGSKDEDGCVPMGAAHFIEHMSFRVQNGKIWSLASKGDVINAETNMDSTRFYVVHLPHQTSETIQIDADRYKSASVPAAKVPIERNAVLNELERGQRVGNKMFQMTSSLAILEHPYHHGTIGTKFDVTNTNAKDMERFRAKYYVPNNTTLIFCGKFDPQQILNDVHLNFGTIPAQPTNQGLTPEPLQCGKRTTELHIEAPCPMICMAFHQPKGNSKESIIMQCISRLTWHNNEGRGKTLIDNNVLHDISTYSPRQLEPYLWYFHGTLEEGGNTQDAEQNMFRILQTFITHPVSFDELNGVKMSMKDDWTRGLESVTDMMNELGRGVSMGNWKDVTEREYVLESIIPEDIKSVAKLVFRAHRMTVTHVKPSKNKSPACTSTETKHVNLKKSPITLETPKGTKKEMWSVQPLSVCTNLLHVPRAKYVRVTLSARFSPAFHDMASVFVSNLGQNLTSKLTTMHAERNFSHDHEFVHMTMSIPADTNTMKHTASLMFDQEWMKPSFTSSCFEQKKRHIITEMNSLQQNQEYLVKSNFIKSLFKQTMYHIPLDTRTQRIQNLTLDDLYSFHSKWIDTSETFVTIVTPSVDFAVVLGEIFPANEKGSKQTLEWEPLPRKSSTKHIELKGYGSFQVMLGQSVPVKSDTSDAIALQCAIEILGGGMTGRLMHTVREQRGLGTYGLYAVLQHVSPKTDAIFCIQGTFSPNSVKEGLECTKTLLTEWQQHGVTPSELQNAKDRMVGSRVIASDSVDHLHGMVVQSIVKGKDPEKHFNDFEHQVNALEIESVNTLLKKLIDPDKMVEIVVGPNKIPI